MAETLKVQAGENGRSTIMELDQILKKHFEKDAEAN